MVVVLGTPGDTLCTMTEANDFDRRWSDLGEFIREQRAIGELSLRKLSERAGVSNPYLSQIERGLRRPSAEILQQIARALEISAETLYVRAGILDEPTGVVDPVGEIRRDVRITEDQKKTLIHIYDSFLRESGWDREPEDPATGDDVAPDPPTEVSEHPVTGGPPRDDPAGDDR